MLLLNASYEPLRVCSVRRAVRLVMEDIADAVEQSPLILRSPSTVFHVPSVIKLRHYVRLKQQPRVPLSRTNVFRRDQYRCQYCLAHGGILTLDHVMPSSRGGLTTWDNVVTACQACNGKKGNRTPQEARMPLHTVPRAPKFLVAGLWGVTRIPDPAWEKYLPSA